MRRIAKSIRAAAKGKNINRQQCEEIVRLLCAGPIIDGRLALGDLALIDKHGYCPTVAYEIAGDAYLQLKELEDAELMYMTAILMGYSSNKIYINLANLAQMRGDRRLAAKWVAELEATELQDDIKGALENLKNIMGKTKDNSKTPFRYSEEVKSNTAQN